VTEKYGYDCFADDGARSGSNGEPGVLSKVRRRTTQSDDNMNKLLKGYLTKITEEPN
jgi:hypothetical protein